MKTAYIDIMASTTRTTYIGVTTDPEGRVWQHKTHAYEGFTKRYNVTKLVYIEGFSRIDDAIAWEKALKVKTRAKQIALIEERNPRWNDLAWNWFEDIPARGAPASLASAVTCSSRGDSSPPAQIDGMLGTHPKT